MRRTKTSCAGPASYLRCPHFGEITFVNASGTRIVEFLPKKLLAFLGVEVNKTELRLKNYRLYMQGFGRPVPVRKLTKKTCPTSKSTISTPVKCCLLRRDPD